MICRWLPDPIVRVNLTTRAAQHGTIRRLVLYGRILPAYTKEEHQLTEIRTTFMMAIASTCNIDLDLYKKGDVTVCALFDEIEGQCAFLMRKFGL